MKLFLWLGDASLPLCARSTTVTVAATAPDASTAPLWLRSASAHKYFMLNCTFGCNFKRCYAHSSTMRTTIAMETHEWEMMLTALAWALKAEPLFDASHISPCVHPYLVVVKRRSPEQCTKWTKTNHFIKIKRNQRNKITIYLLKPNDNRKIKFKII